MVSLNDYIKESLLDDEDVLMDRDESIVLTREIQRLISDRYEVSSDRKYILMRVWQSSLNIGDGDISLNKIKEINKLNLKFQPVRKIDIRSNNCNQYLKQLPCNGCGWLDVIPYDGVIDFNNLQFLPKAITLTTKCYKHINPPKQQVDFVSVSIQDGNYDELKNWNCDCLLLDAEPFEEWNNDVSVVGDFNQEKLQKIVDNNPNVNEFILIPRHYTLGKVYKIRLKGVKRLVEKSITRGTNYLDKFIDPVDDYVKNVVKKFEKKYGNINKPISLHK